MLFFLKIFVKIDYQVIGLENLKEELKKGPVILGCNHQSIWETLVIYKFFNNGLSAVIKKELTNVPIGGMYFKKLGCIAIDRKSTIKSIKQITTMSEKSIENGVSILIFPSGTRANVVNYKFSGIYSMYQNLKNIPVIPAKVDSGKYWPKRSFKKKPGTITLEFKKTIYPGLSRNDFIKEFQNKMDE